MRPITITAYEKDESIRDIMEITDPWTRTGSLKSFITKHIKEVIESGLTIRIE